MKSEISDSVCLQEQAYGFQISMPADSKCRNASQIIFWLKKLDRPATVLATIQVSCSA